jgi:hypothetical protein
LEWPGQGHRTFGVGNAHFRTATKSGYVDAVAFGAYRKRGVRENQVSLMESWCATRMMNANYRVIKAGYRICLSS